ncbi:ankyrin-1-like [Mytilus californianus]|uniref:ankyrin-1-like n=1 Tax=Mytilus californianus TaxID=6549 RepID=UPI00224511CD|nr:ankyrin-1-like [Mytilus californianus]
MSTITEEEENYVRMSLLLYGIAPRAARAYFDSEFAPSCLYKSIKREFSKLNQLKKDKKINTSQWNLLFPRKGVPDSKTFDVTLIITLFRNLIDLNPPDNGFDNLPSVTDATPSAALATIKYYRNYIAHIQEAKMNSFYFTKAWDDITRAVGTLGGTNMFGECKELRTRVLEQSTVPWNIREQIRQILEAWNMNKSNFVETRAAKYVLKCIQENSCVTITASSGVGKTATLQYVALKMKDKEYDVLLVTDAHDIVKFYNPNRKTLFVIDDFCGIYSINQFELNSLESVMDRIKVLIENKLTKIIVACRLQVYQDDKFESLSVFRTCVCNMLSEDLCLSKTEKQSIAELYLDTKSTEIIQYCDLYECFPLLCKLYSDSHELNITEFFMNPFSVYDAEIDKLNKKGNYGKYCALALCVMFNNRLKEQWLTDDINKRIRTIIENTCEACRLDRETSRLVLLDELKTLEYTFIRTEQGVYKFIHDKIFDFLAFYFGKKMIQCMIKNGHSLFISKRFALERRVEMDQFITIVPPKYHQMYIKKMIGDWSFGSVQHVFNNISMTIPEFRKRFLDHLNTLDISFQTKLALTCDVASKGTVLLQCCQYDDIPLIQWCIYLGADINQCRNDNATPLHISSHCGHAEVVMLLLDNKADINKCTDRGSSPLYIACQQNHIKTIKLLLDNNADINKCTDTGTSPLFIACQKNHIKTVKILLDTNADINKCRDGGASPLFTACQNNHIETVKILLDNKADINKCTDKGTSSLFIACDNNHIEIIKILLDNKADINQSTDNGISPFFIACQNNHIEIVKVLLDKKADINKCANDGVSPLFIACQNNHIEIVKVLLDNKADIVKCPDDGISHLYNACQNNQIEIVRLLLDNKVEINKCTDNGSSPVFIACQKNHIEIVKVLLNNNADINKCRDDGASPLFISIQKNHIEIIKALLDKNADISKCLDNGQSPLNVACRNNHVEIVKVLLDNKADINKCSDSGVSPLTVACSTNDIEIVKVLLDNKADINKCTDNGASPLFYACHKNHIETVKLLLDNQVDIDKCTDIGTSPLYIACQNKYIETVKLLLDNKADINKCMDGRVSPLFIACQNNHKETVKLLLNNKADINKCTDDRASPLYIACRNNHKEIVNALLDNKADFNKCVNNGASPFYVACNKNHIEIAKVLLDNKADINKCRDNGASPLYTACQNNHIDMVKVLLENKANIDKCMDDGSSPLYIACQYNHIDIVRMLLEKGSDYNKCHNIGISPKQIASENGNDGILAVINEHSGVEVIYERK